MKPWLYMILVAALSGCGTSEAPAPESSETVAPALRQGVWRAVMQSPGGELPFRVTVSGEPGNYEATAHNADEVLNFDRVEVGPTGEVTLAIDHYESQFIAKLNEDGNRLEGEWTKVAGPAEISRLPFHAEYGNMQRFNLSGEAQPAEMGGRWAVTFADEGDPSPAVAEFTQTGDKLTGTFLTPTGDYRFLEGSVDGNKLYLSCFDGGHAFLFTATLGEDDTLTGDFWSRDTWHDTWTAYRDPDAKLDDAFTLTSLSDGAPTFRFSFPDLDGKTVSHDDPVFDGKVRLVTIFGSWCPNCNDEAPFLQELKETYGDQGLEIIGLAFEMTPDVERSRKVLKRFQKRHKVDYRILIAGGSKDKTEAAQVLPDIEHVLSYPTTIFIDREGKVIDIYTGYSGPGTGDYYEDLKTQWHERIKALL